MELQMGHTAVYMVILNLLVSLRVTTTNGEPGVSKEYCEDSSFSAECPEGEVVVMEEARYGRMSLGVCLVREYDAMGCSSDVLPIMDRWCSGRRKCEVGVRDLVIEVAKPCPRDLRSYLQARYTCLPVVTPAGECCKSTPYALVEGESGFLANSVSETTGCGSLDCPWLLEAPKGQRINITLYDFATPYKDPNIFNDPVPYGQASTCHVHAIIKEIRNRQVASTQTICAGEARHRHIFLTSSNQVEIRITSRKRSEREAYFLIQYEAIGCADLSPPAYGYAERTGNRMKVGCKAGPDVTWTVTCRDNRWHGKIGNCTAVVAKTGGVLDNILSLTPDVSIVIIVIVAITIALGILIIGIVCLRRKWTKAPRQEKKPHPPLPQRADDRRNSNYISRSENKNNAIMDATLQREPHNYFRTWELQRHNNRQDGVVDNNQDYDARYVEHIYESPTFTRKDLPDLEAGSQQYYELDPEAEPFHPAHIPPTNITPLPTVVNGVHSLPKNRCSYPDTNTGDPRSMPSHVAGSFTS